MAMKFDIDLQTKEMIQDPFPTYKKMLRDHPICKVEPGGIWTLCRFDDVRNSLMNYELFTSKRRHEVISPDWQSKECRRELYLINKDPPELAEYRDSINHAFKGVVVRKLLPLMQTTARTITETIKKKIDIEVLGDIAYPFIGEIIGTITGMSGKQAIKETREWIQGIEILSLKKPDDRTLTKMQTAIIKQNAYFDDVVQSKKFLPGNDFVSKLIRANIGGNPLSDFELRNALDLVIVSGYQTTAHLVASAFAHLASNPDIHCTLNRNPSLIPAFVEETLRLYPPVAMTMRHTTQSITLHGVTIPAKDPVVLLIAAANRDPEHHPSPNDFDLYRAKHKHISFGYGTHMCLGLALAKLEVETLLSVILPEVQSIECPPIKELQWLPTCFLRGLKRLPARVR
jgi:cytochrome P450